MKRYTLPLIFAAAALVASCSSDDDSTPESTKSRAVKNYATIVEASYDDAIIEAKNLKTTINSFTANPSQSGLNECKEAWLAARVPYGQTEAYRFYEGPIDNEVTGPEGALNAWPLDENYIDYTRDNTDDGIIANTDYPLTKEKLREDNEKSDTYIIIGYHAIEFMLWGQDDLNPSNGQPGSRPLTDFTSANFASRRKEYLNILAEILIEDLELVHNQWVDGGAYRTSFEGDVNASISKMFAGIGELSGPELAGERMRVALKVAKEKGNAIGQEDEHSCFSDNTHNDILLNFEGCVNVLRGSYERINGSTVSGISLLDVLREVNTDLATSIDNKATEAYKKAGEIEQPFDKALIDDQADIEATIALLDQFGNLAADANLAVQ